MKVCFMCDLHLPFDKKALQYDVLNWAIDDILKTKPEIVVYAGDVTCDGNEEVYDFFVDTMKKKNTRFLYIPGNSDLRCADSRDSIKNNCSACKNVINGISVFAVNDSDNNVSDEQLAALDAADSDSIVFMHHPLYEHKNSDKLLNWRETHPHTMLFYGHLHKYMVEGCSVSLPAADPDKSIGESPCILYFDTVTKEITKSHYSTGIPSDLTGYFGISCYKPGEQIDFAINNKLKYIELRPGCIKIPREELFTKVKAWREVCGENLSIHLPDVGYKDGRVVFDEGFDEVVELITYLNADRVTLHVPKVSVGEIDKNPAVLEEICVATTDRLNSVGHNITIGIENMHMTSGDKADRRFGYIPEECLLFMEKIALKTSHKTGINFDIGHARNNAPYSQKYQIGTWLSMLGKHIVGYHLHQVTPGKGKFENHMPITEVYGNLICYASFFKCWETGRINKVPVIFEMRPEGAYETTLRTFGMF